MEISQFIQVRRHPYEEPRLTQVVFHASKGLFIGSTDIYCEVADLDEIGAAVSAFPTKVPDAYRFEYGPEQSEKRFYRYFLLRAFTTDWAGHCAIQFRMNRNVAEPMEGMCGFSIRAEAARFNRLGALILRLHKCSRGELRWRPVEGDGFDEDAGERAD